MLLGNRRTIRKRKCSHDSGKNNDKSAKSALAQHHFKYNHNSDFDNIEFLDNESNYYKQGINEKIQNRKPK